MNANQFRKQLHLEQNLKLGDSVILCWTNSGHYYAARAQVVRINQKSVVGELIETVNGLFGGYPIGRKITVPRITARWSINNRVTN